MKPIQSIYIGLDQGTSSTKAVVININGEILKHYREEVSSNIISENNVTQNPEELYQSIRKILEEASKDFSKDYKIEGLALSCQRSGVCAFKKDTGESVHDLLSWRDRSTKPVIDSLSEAEKEYIIKNNSLALIPDYAACKISTLQAKFPEPDVLIGTLDTYLIYKLSKGEAFISDHSMSAHTLLYDFEKASWSKGLCKAFKVKQGRLAKIVPSIGSGVSLSLENGEKIPLLALLPDKQSGLAGIIKNQYEVYIDLGSTFSLCIPTAESTVWSKGCFTSVLSSQDNKRSFFIEALINYPGPILSSVIKKRLASVEPEYLEKLIAEVAEEHLGSAYFPKPSTACPLWLYDLPSVISKACLKDDRIFVKVLVEHMACGFIDCLNIAKKEKIINLQSTIKVSGGFSKISYLLQFIADVTGLTFQVLEESGGSAYGVILLALEKLKTEQLSRAIKIGKVIKPQADSDKAKKIYADWALLRDLVISQKKDSIDNNYEIYKPKYGPE